MSADDAQEELLEAVFATHYDRLLRFAYLLTGGRDAEDLVQDTIVLALRKWDPSRPIEAFGAWARTTLLRLYLKRGRGAGLERRALTILTAGDRPVAPPESSADTLAALRSLPPRQRAAVVLFYFEDRSEAEIADRMGVRPGTVKALLNQGRARLRIELED